MFRREKDSRRVANSIRDHKETMAAFGRATIKDPNVLRGQIASTTDKAGKTTHHINTDPSKY